jgi:hypothetical protein
VLSKRRVASRCGNRAFFSRVPLLKQTLFYLTWIVARLRQSQPVNFVTKGREISSTSRQGCSGVVVIPENSSVALTESLRRPTGIPHLPENVTAET